MPESPLRLVKRCAEYQAIDQIAFVPAKRRGLYVLYRKRRIKGKETYAVVYVGLATTSIRRRLASHRRTKGNSWTHFSIFEGLFRHFYKKDPRASRLNVQRGFKKIRWVRNNDLTDWGDVE